ncbi:type II toxin-antitoxin system antitoxin SocA domain-containing protein [Paraclostridium dentum]|uniref:type II toxin-antitoxin system antitoxin SocA domain-containing protein n=1 Tax=Paraclostridium dentum TaxID=2662455 RepID=UPI003B0099EA
MISNIDFCEKCLDDRKYTIIAEENTKTVRGYNIKYIKKQAVCDTCQSIMYIPEINDENLNEYYSKIRDIDKIVSIEDIEKIIEKYNIKKRPLSKLLGWGETTLTRYIDGSLPTREYSDKLKLILNSINEMENLLEANKCNISDIAYKKCKEAINNLKDEKAISLEEEDCKIYRVSNYLIKKCGDITPLALQKMLYYCQAFCKVFTGKYLFENECQAWVHGPVYVEVYNKYSKFGGSIIELCDEKTYLENQDEEEIVECVAKYFGKYSGRTLELMTHMERPWRDTRKGLKVNESSNKVIEKDLIESYFNIEKEKCNMVNVSDITEYIDSLLKKI